MAKVKKFKELTNEEFQFGGKYTEDVVKSLLAKVKKIIPQDRIDKFIEENREQVEQLSEQLSNDKGDLDFGKITEFINKNKK
jgi:hypothetical protein